MADLPNAEVLEQASDLGKSPEATARRWKLELKLAHKRESMWRKKVSDIYKLYTPDIPAANSFNILWPNTETLRQAVYNSLPQPDARRRYQDDDALGKAVGEVLTRALEFAQDTYDFDGVLKGDVLAMLLAGRGLSRVRYVPQIKTLPNGQEDEQGELNETETYEEIEWEQVICEKVQWDDFRILCAAKTWDEVNAIAFRHRFNRDDCIEKFGDEIGKAIPLDSADDEDVKSTKDSADLFKTAEIWEIWNKEDKEVVWLCPTYANPCKVQDDPLKLQGFFPIPRPLYAIENDSTLIPACLYTQYEQQAKELNEISKRINNLVKALKVRGIYDATLTELSELMKAGDNELVPTANVTALIERGGLDKAIWLMPIEQAAAVIKELYIQRDATKQIIYEITGISDIMRSASDPNETFGAQKIKTQWGTQRLQRMQKEVQRYIRDLIRLKAEVISDKFQPETLEAMTLVKLPHQQQVDQQKQQMMMQYQQAAQQAQQQGQPAPPMPPQQPDPITWEAVVDALHNDATRTYRIDIETDSTLSASQDSDMQAIQQGIAAIGQIGTVFGPAVQQGDMDVETLKQLMLAVTRKMKMGSAVEDALSKMKQPAPPTDPEAGKAQAAMQAQQAQQQHEMQIEQIKAQNQAQIEQLKAQSNQSSEQARMQADAQVEQARAQASIAVEQAKQSAQFQVDEAKRQHEIGLAQMGHDHAGALHGNGVAFDQWKVEYENGIKLAIAELQAKTSMQQTSITANANNKDGTTQVDEQGNTQPNAGLAALIDAMNSNLSMLVDGQQQKHAEMVQAITRPKTATLSNGKTVTIN